MLKVEGITEVYWQNLVIALLKLGKSQSAAKETYLALSRFPGSEFFGELLKFQNEERIKNSSDPLLTIIVLVHDSGKYLDQCLKSIIDQSYKNFELIIACNNSSNNSTEIIEAFRGKDSRIRVITNDKEHGSDHENAGNQAITIASGAYIGFVDSDDWVDVGYFESLVNRALDGAADIALAGGFGNFKNGSSELKIFTSRKAFEYVPEEYKKYERPDIRGKIFSSRLVNTFDIRLGKTKATADFPFILRAYFFSQRVCFGHDLLGYNCRKPSASNGCSPSYLDSEKANLALHKLLRRAQIYNELGRQELALEQLSSVRTENLVAREYVSHYVDFYCDPLLKEFKSGTENDASEDLLLKELVLAGIETQDFENCFWDLASYIRKYHASPDALSLAETVHEFLVTSKRPDLADKLEEDYLYAARVLAREYIEPGQYYRAVNFVDSFQLDLPDIQGNANDFLGAVNQSARLKRKAVNSYNVVLIWGKADKDSRAFWEEMSLSFPQYHWQFLLNEKSGQSVPPSELFSELDGNIRSGAKEDLARVLICHAGLRLTRDTIEGTFDVDVPLTSVLVPQFELPEFGQEATKVCQHLRELNERVTTNKDYLYHRRASLLACALNIGDLKDFHFSPIEPIKHLIYSDYEFFFGGWKIKAPIL